MRILTVLATSWALWGADTALDRYVAEPDPHYAWSLVKTDEPAPGVRAYRLEMTSQRWRSEAEVDRPVWKHFLTILRPSRVEGNTAFLFITGGANDNREPRLDASLLDTANRTSSIVAELRMVPNQPLQFAGMEKPGYEDALIAYTWEKFIQTGDEKWPMRLPMTKAAVRAMDTVIAFAATDPGGRATVRDFVVAGASKRGWTTWTTAAVDKRVRAIAPLVIDCLNVEESFISHFRSLGFWAPAVGDYQARNLMDWLGTAENRKLMAIEDPYSYRDRLTMPKYIVNSAGDQFFLPDSWQFYFDGLPAEKHLRYVPNTDHSLRGSDAAQSLAAFHDMIVKGRALPRYSWSVTERGFQIRLVDKPVAMKLWTAENPDARDFRLEKLGPKYVSKDIPGGPDELTVEPPPPAKGFQASFVELQFDSGGPYPLKVTTGVRITPNRYPFDPPKTRATR
jgi:PhoPQ-activated pathogenicity-related protein